MERCGYTWPDGEPCGLVGDPHYHHDPTRETATVRSIRLTPTAMRVLGIPTMVDVREAVFESGGRRYLFRRVGDHEKDRREG